MMIVGHHSIADGPSGDLSNSHIACLECDLLMERPKLTPGDRAECPRCKSLVTSMPHDAFARALAFAIAASALLVVANLFPFLSFRASGLEQVMTLSQSAGVLYEQGNLVLAAFVLTFIAIAPGVLTLCLIGLLVPLVLGHKVAGMHLLGRAVFLVSTWSMVEVFLIGVLVSFIKIAAMATVVFGMSFWAFIGFALCLTAALSYLDRHQVWSAIEEARP